jgi:hypothetical protein
MPMPTPEPLPTIIRVRVVNKNAPHAGEEGWIVNTGTSGALTYIDVRFMEGDQPVRYIREEVELCQM